MAAMSALAIYGFGRFERIYGQWQTLHMVLWLTIPFAVVCGVGALVGLKVGSAGPLVKVPNHRLWVAGGMYAIVVAALAGVSELAQVVWVPWTFSFLSALAAGAILARGSAMPEHLESRTPAGATPLHVAALRGDRNAVRELLDGGADPNAMDEAGRTPLHEALRHPHLQVARMLVAAGGQWDTKDRDGVSPRAMAKGVALWEGEN